MKLARALGVLLLTTALTPAASFGWGRDGHKITAEIASGRLDAKAQANLRALLGAQSLADVANWADEIKSDHRWDWAKPLHYADMPPGADTFDLKRDCPKNGCVVSAIQKYAAVLRNEKASAASRMESLKFLIHFVGDVHCPMHVAFAHDKGGNDVAVEFFYNRTNLHKVWDSLLIERQRLYWKDYARRLTAQITAGDAKRWTECMNPCAWATETHQLAVAYAYAIPKDAQLGQAYLDRSIPIVDEQLSAAGIRLAALLNATFAQTKGLPVPAATEPAPAATTAATKPAGDKPVRFVGSRHSKVYHYPGCPAVKTISPQNLEEYDSAPTGKKLHKGCQQ